MCNSAKTIQKMYRKRAHGAIINLLIDKSDTTICQKCAYREIGSKRKKEIDELEKDS